jgi:hypothetical protein
MLRFLGILALLVTVYVVLHDWNSVAANLNKTRIDEILAAPRTYEGKGVTVHGIVTGGVGMVGVGGYHMRDVDGQQELFVLSGTGVPPTGATVTVHGTFQQAFTLGSYQLPVIMIKP